MILGKELTAQITNIPQKPIRDHLFHPSPTLILRFSFAVVAVMLEWGMQKYISKDAYVKARSTEVN